MPVSMGVTLQELPLLAFLCVLGVLCAFALRFSLNVLTTESRDLDAVGFECRADLSCEFHRAGLVAMNA